MIKEIIVVEGTHDKIRLQEIFECDVITTNGSEVSNETLELIKKAQIKRGVIIFTDPDSPGESIRNKIINYVPGCKHAFVKKEDAIGKRNVGIEYAKREAIIEALEHVYEINDKEITISWEEYTSSGIMFVGSKSRNLVAQKLNLGKVNNKQLFKRLNMFGISKELFLETLEGIKGNS